MITTLSAYAELPAGSSKRRYPNPTNVHLVARPGASRRPLTEGKKRQVLGSRMMMIRRVSDLVKPSQCFGTYLHNSAICEEDTAAL